MNDKKISNNEAIDAALRLDGDPEKIRLFYDDWADKYNSDTGSADYSGPAIAAGLLSRHLPDTQSLLLDAGCGTGQVGSQLAARGYHRIDGFDLSQAMTALAADIGCYRQLIGGVDIMKAGESYAAASYDAVLSIGVFTPGHVPPTALAVLSQLTRANGLLVISTRTHYYDQSGFQQMVDELTDNGQLTLLQSLMHAPYNNDGDAHYWVFKKSG